MKIATITFGYSQNLGTLLQAYALSEYINSIGHECKIIKFREFDQRPFETIKGIPDALSDIVFYGDCKKKMKKINIYRNCYLPFTDKCYPSAADMGELNEQFDCFVAGSDQIWNVHKGIFDEFFLSFVNDDKKKVAYAASFGLTKIPEEYVDGVKEGLARFDAISVREVSGVQLAHDLTGNTYPQAVDPVFLKPKKEWEELCKERTNPIYIVGLLLIPDYSLLLHGEINTPSRKMVAIVGYQFAVILLAVLEGNTSDDNLVFTLFVLVMCVFVSNSNYQFDSEFFIKIGWGLTGLGSLVLCYLVTDGFTDFVNTQFMRLPMGGDRLTLSAIAFAYLIFMLCYKASNYLMFVLKIVFSITAVIDVLACSRRGLMFSYFLILFVFIIKKMATNKREISVSTFRNIALVMLFIVIIWFLISRSDDAISQSIKNYVSKLVNAFEAYTGTSNVADSGTARRDVLSTIPHEYLFDSTVWEFLFGKGVFYQQIDVPYLQAFWDMGFFMGVYYFVLQFVLPISLIFKKNETEAELFAQLFAIQMIMYNIYSGTCYGHYKFAPLILLCFLFDARQSYVNEEKL